MASWEGDDDQNNRAKKNCYGLIMIDETKHCMSIDQVYMYNILFFCLDPASAFGWFSRLLRGGTTLAF
jgi:hypothetical protein